MRLLTLGGLGLEGSPFARPKPLLLLAYLALEGPQDKRHLAELFWPRAKSAARSLNVALTQLRQGAAGAIEAGGHRLGTSLATDAGDFLELVEQGAAREAEAHYHGAFLEGLRLELGVELEEWIYRTREFLADQARRVLLDRAEAEALEGRFRDAARCAERASLLRGAGFPEPRDLSRLYTLLLAGNSLRAEWARREAQTFGMALPPSAPEARRRLRRSLGGRVSPSLPIRTTSFVGRQEEARAVLASLRDGCRLLSLLGPAGVGKSRLAVHCAKSAEQAGGFEDVRFVPLEAAQNERQMLRAVAAGLRPDAGAPDPGLEQIARTIGRRAVLLVLDNFEQLVAGAGTLGRLLALCPNLQLLVTSRERLNVEEEQAHLVAGLAVPAPPVPLEDARSFAAVELFCQRARRAQAAFVLEEATLPAVLQICRRVGGLPLGLELAAAWLRLMSVHDVAAALARDLDLLETSFRDVSERHRSMRKAFDGSWALLSERERAVFAGLSVFRGGFRREAARAVAGASMSVLAALVDKSLVRPEPPDRYSLHPLLLQYAREKLEAMEKLDPRDGPDAGEHPAARRHAEVFLALAEEARPQLTGPEPGPWLRRLDADHDNLRAALGWFRAHEVGRAMRLAAALWRFWIMRAHNQEGRELLGELLALPGAQAPSEARTSLLQALGTLAFETGDFAGARPVLREALAIARGRGDARGVASILNTLGWIAAHLGDAPASKACSEEALGLHAQAGDTRGRALAHNNLGFRAFFLGAFAEARDHLRESLRLFEALGDERGVAHLQASLALAQWQMGFYGAADALLAGASRSLRQMGDKQLLVWALYQQTHSSLNQGQVERAEAAIREALPLVREVGNHELRGMVLTAYGDVLAERGQVGEAARRLEEARGIWRAAGYPWVRALTFRVSARVAQREDKPAEAQGMLRRSLAIALEIGDRHGVARCLELLALLEPDGTSAQAARLLAVADDIRTAIRAPLPPRFAARYRQKRDAIRRRLGRDGFETSWQEGRAAGPEAVLAAERLQR